ncbi:hypothetical protein L873DRAFT_418464 [Choiromyces venosus 120613-1]|uniref:Galactose oxidase n=1 Tax=Choiromyces venosus 120613-1 TaxID=1336337 RepID=A0A3N4JWJ0_9PEZI|nr:hypothetical protein L873DRAFT_418464 [Choiromyces venosus 120613-1]
MRFGSIWAHNTIIYLGSSDLEIYSLLRNGVWSNEPRKVPTKDVWTYDTANREAVWASVSGVEYNGTFNPVTKGSVAFLDGKAYVMGGTYGLSTTLKNPDGTPATPDLAEVEDVKLSSLLKLDVERKVFINETSSIGHVDSGRMVAIKGVGQKGVLIYIGGESSSGYNDMSTIRIYDIATSTWKSQKATAKDGDFPRGRIDFCAVVMSAQDNSSHQIYFYGGYSDGPGTRLPLDDAWVLTLPYFQYLKVGNSIEATRISGFRRRLLRRLVGTKLATQQPLPPKTASTMNPSIKSSIP